MGTQGNATNDVPNFDHSLVHVPRIGDTDRVGDCDLGNSCCRNGFGNG